MEVKVSIWWALVLAYYENMEILSRGLISRKAYQGSYWVITEPSKTLNYWLCLAFGLLNGRVCAEPFLLLTIWLSIYKRTMWYVWWYVTFLWGDRWNWNVKGKKMLDNKTCVKMNIASFFFLRNCHDSKKLMCGTRMFDWFVVLSWHETVDVFVTAWRYQMNIASWECVTTMDASIRLIVTLLVRHVNQVHHLRC